MTSASAPVASELPILKADQPQPSTSTSFYAAAHAASAARAEAAEAAVSSEASAIAARLTGREGAGENLRQQEQRRRPPRCWPRSALRRVDAEARRRGRRCVMWDDSGEQGFCCWVRWDWEKGQPLTAKEEEEEAEDKGGKGEIVTDACLRWESLCRSLGPPLTPAREIPVSEVGAWLDEHTMRVHGWGGGDDASGDAGEGGGRKEGEGEKERRR